MMFSIGNRSDVLKGVAIGVGVCAIAYEIGRAHV